MHKALEQAIRQVIQDAMACSTDQCDLLQGMPLNNLSLLIIEFERYCKKHGKAKLIRQ